MLKEFAIFALGLFAGSQKKGSGLGFLIVLGLLAYTGLAILVGIKFMIGLCIVLPYRILRAVLAHLERR
jgi:hypothetical protein